MIKLRWTGKILCHSFIAVLITLVIANSPALSQQIKTMRVTQMLEIPSWASITITALSIMASLFALAGAMLRIATDASIVDSVILTLFTSFLGIFIPLILGLTFGKIGTILTVGIIVNLGIFLSTLIVVTLNCSIER